MVEFYTRKFYGNTLYHAKIQEFDSVPRQIYQFYVALAPPKRTPEPNKTKSSDLCMDVDDEELVQFLYESYSSDVDCTHDMEK